MKEFVDDAKMHRKMHDEILTLSVKINSDVLSKENAIMRYEIDSKTKQTIFYFERKKNSKKIITLELSDNGKKFVATVSDDIADHEKLCKAMKSKHYSLLESKYDSSIWEKVIAK